MQTNVMSGGLSTLLDVSIAPSRHVWPMDPRSPLVDFIFLAGTTAGKQLHVDDHAILPHQGTAGQLRIVQAIVGAFPGRCELVPFAHRRSLQHRSHVVNPLPPGPRRRPSQNQISYQYMRRRSRFRRWLKWGGVALLLLIAVAWGVSLGWVTAYQTDSDITLQSGALWIVPIANGFTGIVW